MASYNMAPIKDTYADISKNLKINMQEEMQSQKIKLEPNDINLVTAGRTVYLQNCASCHGIQLEGQKNWRRRNSEGYLPAPPHDETGHTWQHSASYLFNMTKYGIE